MHLQHADVTTLPVEFFALLDLQKSFTGRRMETLKSQKLKSFTVRKRPKKFHRYRPLVAKSTKKFHRYHWSLKKFHRYRHAKKFHRQEAP